MKACSDHIHKARFNRIRDDDQQHQIVVSLEVSDADLSYPCVCSYTDYYDSDRQQDECLFGTGNIGTSHDCMVWRGKKDNKPRAMHSLKKTGLLRSTIYITSIPGTNCEANLLSHDFRGIGNYPQTLFPEAISNRLASVSQAYHEPR